MRRISTERQAGRSCEVRLVVGSTTEKTAGKVESWVGWNRTAPYSWPSPPKNQNRKRSAYRKKNKRKRKKTIKKKEDHTPPPLHHRADRRPLGGHHSSAVRGSVEGTVAAEHLTIPKAKDESKRYGPPSVALRAGRPLTAFGNDEPADDAQASFGLAVLRAGGCLLSGRHHGTGTTRKPAARAQVAEPRGGFLRRRLATTTMAGPFWDQATMVRMSPGQHSIVIKHCRGAFEA